MKMYRIAAYEMHVKMVLETGSNPVCLVRYMCRLLTRSDQAFDFEIISDSTRQVANTYFFRALIKKRYFVQIDLHVSFK